MNNFWVKRLERSIRYLEETVDILNRALEDIRRAEQAALAQDSAEELARFLVGTDSLGCFCSRSQTEIRAADAGPV